MAAFLTVLLGLAGLAVDIALAELQQFRAQNAADAAALAGAADLAGQAQSSALTDAQHYAAVNGFTTGVNNVTVSVASPPTDSQLHNGDPDAIEVTITQQVPTMFMRALGIASTTVAVRAIAATAAGAPCAVCVLSPTATGALSGNGNGSLTVTGAGVDVDSTSASAATLNGNGSVDATGIGIVGGYSTTGNASFSPVPATGILPVPDPLAGVPPPAVTGSNLGSIHVSANRAETIGPGIYTDFTISGNGSLTLEPGTYVITGTVSISGNGQLLGNGVTLYFTCSAYSSTDNAPCQGQAGGSLDLSGNGTYSVTAPTSGTYQGLAVFYDRGNTATLALSGNGSDDFTGTIYAKSAAATLSGNGGTEQVDALVIVNTLTMNGNGGVSIDYQAAENYSVRQRPALSQ